MGKKGKKKKRKVSKKKKEQILQARRKTIITIVGVLALFIAIFAFFSNKESDYVLKSEYALGENGYIDDIAIKLSSVEYINNDTGIQLSFEITNKKDNTITIIPDDYFKFYDINKVQIPNKYTNDTNIIKKNDTVIYKLQYDVTQKELYEIHFYSQTVENNIKFTFKSSDIKINNVDENKDIEDEKSIDDEEDY